MFRALAALLPVLLLLTGPACLGENEEILEPGANCHPRDVPSLTTRRCADGYVCDEHSQSSCISVDEWERKYPGPSSGGLDAGMDVG